MNNSEHVSPKKRQGMKKSQSLGEPIPVAEGNIEN